MNTPRIAYILDPRFPGGTSSAVAAELEVVSQMAQVTVHAVSTAMFKGATPAPQLLDTLIRLDIPVVWDALEIAADVAIFHNPSCLRFQDHLPTRIIAHHMIVVAHENFVRPGGAEAFEVRKCLDQLEASSYVGKRTLAPISDWNRQTIADWARVHDPLKGWHILDVDWFNICPFDLHPPTDHPRDRRGRLSRPGLEKFPQDDVMAICFPPHAMCNVILGADALMAREDTPQHWQLIPFRGMIVEQFFEMIDFMIYFTAPTFRESFGRVMAEAVAAGKIVMTDPETARIFNGAVLSVRPEDVDETIRGYIDAPARYVADVQAAQTKLAAFSAQAFRTQIAPILQRAPEQAA